MVKRKGFFGHVTEGMNVVNAIAQDDVITKITITRKGALAKKFDAQKYSLIIF
jgi:cyclophilin family peptidyl-prolyl cis-trans isomerase